MDDNQLQPQPDHSQPHARNLQIPGRQTHSHVPERSQVTADLLREKVNAVYDAAPPNQLKDAQQTQTNPYNRTYTTGQTSAPTFDAQQYHTAWQQYYQQYYQRFYLQQLHVQRQQMAAEKANQAAKPPDDTQQHVITGTDETAPPKNQVEQFKNELLDKVKERAKKVRRSHHFMPIVSAIVIGLLFLFLQYNRLMIAEVKAYVSPGANEGNSVLIDPTNNVNVGPDPKLIIPKINVNIKVVYDVKTLEENAIQEGLNHGVVHYNLPGANSLPGQIGNTVLLGHSSNDIFAPGDYKFAFVQLDRMEKDDIFYINYQGKRYVYRVTEKKVILPTELNALQINNGKPMATLITCTPLGTALKRLLVIAEQISPDPSAATAKPTDNPTNEPNTLPGNSPTLLDNIRDFFF